MKINAKQAQLFKVVNEIYEYIIRYDLLEKILEPFKTALRNLKTKKSLNHSNLIINGKLKAKILRQAREANIHNIHERCIVLSALRKLKLQREKLLIIKNSI